MQTHSARPVPSAPRLPRILQGAETTELILQAVEDLRSRTDAPANALAGAPADAPAADAPVDAPADAPADIPATADLASLIPAVGSGRSSRRISLTAGSVFPSEESLVLATMSLPSGRIMRRRSSHGAAPPLQSSSSLPEPEPGVTSTVAPTGPRRTRTSQDPLGWTPSSFRVDEGGEPSPGECSAAATALLLPELSPAALSALYVVSRPILRARPGCGIARRFLLQVRELLGVEWVVAALGVPILGYFRTRQQWCTLARIPT
jgi:hypothetical protein